MYFFGGMPHRFTPKVARKKLFSNSYIFTILLIHKKCMKTGNFFEKNIITCLYFVGMRKVGNHVKAVWVDFTLANVAKLSQAASLHQAYLFTQNLGQITAFPKYFCIHTNPCLFYRTSIIK